MSATVALKTARAAGIELVIDGEELVLEAAAPPPAALLDLLSHHKADILTLLRPGADGWSVEEWLAFFDEKAGIAEFDGGLSRRASRGCTLSEAALSSGSTAIQCRLRRDVVAWCGERKCLAPSSSRSGLSQNTTRGFTPNAGPPGAIRGRPTRLPRWRQSEIRRPAAEEMVGQP